MRLPAFLTNQRPLRMVWQVEGHGRTSYLVGTAHFFPRRFTRALESLLGRVDAVRVEGPVDPESLERIAAHGRDGGDGPRLVERLDAEAVVEICRRLTQCLGCLARGRSVLLPPPPGPECFEEYTGGLRPWMAFFSLFSTCLKWPHAMDRDAFEVAERLGKPVEPLETVEEQIAVLDAIPLDWIVQRLDDVDNWSVYAATYERLFLAGDLTDLVALQQAYGRWDRPSISVRDRILCDRIDPVFRAGRAAAFVGFPHVPGVSRLLTERGYRLTQLEVRPC